MATTTTGGSPPVLAPELLAVQAGQRVFVDTNVLVYASSAQAPLRAQARAALNALATAGAELWTSRQVFREYAASMTRPRGFAGPAPMAVVLGDLHRFAGQFRIAEDGPLVFGSLLHLLGTVAGGGRQVYDANIVATTLTYGVPNLLTHNTADFARFGGYISVVPLVP